MKTIPNYNKIYEDLIVEKFPEQSKELLGLIVKKISNTLQVIELNDRLFKNCSEEDSQMNQRLKAYDQYSIQMILKYQDDNYLTNIELAALFRLSRNTVAKWKKHYVPIN